MIRRDWSLFSRADNFTAAWGARELSTARAQKSLARDLRHTLTTAFIPCSSQQTRESHRCTQLGESRRRPFGELQRPASSSGPRYPPSGGTGWQTEWAAREYARPHSCTPMHCNTARSVGVRWECRAAGENASDTATVSAPEESARNPPCDAQLLQCQVHVTPAPFLK